jgi:hypothetical protein
MKYDHLSRTWVPAMSSSRSCLECRRRKIKCDRNHPCSYCIKVGIQCMYADVEGPSRAQQRPKASSPAVSESSARIQMLEDQVQRLEARLSEIEGRAVVAKTVSRGSTPSTTSSIGTRRDRPAGALPDTFTTSGFSLRLWPQYHEIPPEMADASRARSLWEVYLTVVGKFNVYCQS